MPSVFANVSARFALRAVIVGVLAALAVLKVALGDESISGSEAAEIAYSGVLAGAAYAGIGAVSKSVEPSVGRKK